MINIKVGCKKLSEYTLGLFSAIGIIGLATMIVLNLRFIYGAIIDKYNLEQITGVNKERLIKNYNDVINYLENPFIDKLVLQDFEMSVNGAIHFEEVKNIFGFIILISIVFLLWLIINILKRNKIRILIILNNASNIMAIFFVILSAIFTINFSWGFTVFHKVFFRNDYWIFDPKFDPIINALPEVLFFIYGILILLIIISIVIITKIKYHKEKKNGIC